MTALLSKTLTTPPNLAGPAATAGVPMRTQLERRLYNYSPAVQWQRSMQGSRWGFGFRQKPAQLKCLAGMHAKQPCLGDGLDLRRRPETLCGEDPPAREPRSGVILPHQPRPAWQSPPRRCHHLRQPTRTYTMVGQQLL